jgi:hypothetical protein
VPVRDQPRGRLDALLQTGPAPRARGRRAPLLRLADAQPPTPTRARLWQTSAVTVTPPGPRFWTAGLAVARYDRLRPGGRRPLEGRQDAPLVAGACRTPPAGRDRWRVRLCADRLGA